MKSKVVKVVVDVVLSFMFLLVASILMNWIAGMIFGTDSRGNANFNGGVLLAITIAITLVFAVWFFKYVHLKATLKNNARKWR
jgi:hypothetical protein